MIRSILGVIAGALTWMFGFFLMAILLAQVWPAYQVPARAWMERNVFEFPPPQALCNVVFWILAAIAGGWVAMKIARRSSAVGVLAALIGVYLIAMHLFLNWDMFPWWYNLGVVIPAVPAVLWGGRLAGGTRG